MSRFGCLLALAACGRGDDDPGDGPPDDTDPPTEDTTPPDTRPFALGAVSVHPPTSSRVYLVQQLDVSTTLASTLTATIVGADAVARVITWPESNREHRVPLVGLHALEEYTVTVSVRSDAGEVLDADPVTFTNGPLPDPFPTIEVYARDAARLEPGYLLLAPWSTGLGRVVTVLDDAGLPVWAYVPLRDWKAVSATPSGVIGLEGATVPEITWLGETVRRFNAVPEGDDIPLDFGDLHHEVLPLPDGGLYLLTAEPREISGYPLDYALTAFGDATIVNHVAKRVAADGTTLETWSLANLADPTRIGYDSLSYVFTSGNYDWAHANAVVVDETDDSVLISMRNQDAILKFDRATQAIRWIFGQPDGWGPEFQPYLLTATGDDFQWPGHQHAPVLLPGGKMMLYDNGNAGRSNPYSDENIGPVYSRVVQYDIDEVAMTASVDWHWERTLTGVLYSNALGNADPLPVTGNVFATFSYLYNEDGVDHEEMGRGEMATRLIQFSPTDDATVLDLAIYGPLETQPSGWLVDRAVWIPSLYPPAPESE